MSAYIINDSHLYLIAMSVQPSNMQEFSDLLKRINIKSVNYRYSDKTKVSKCKPSPYIIGMEPLKQNEVNSLIQCWLYQSCEIENDLMFDLVEGYLKLWMLTNT
jgi:hypothetical protein